MFFKKKETQATRTINDFRQLQVGDLISFKFREVFPDIISGETLSVESINTYDYMGELVSDFVLSHSSGFRVNATYDSEQKYITLSHKIGHPEIIEIFDGDQLATIFDPEQEPAELELRPEAVSDKRKAWVCERYTRTLCEAQGYYYNKDRRGLGVSLIIQ